MEFEEVVKRRRSVRRFIDEDVPENVIHEIIELGHEAPSAGNLQARDFVLVRDKTLKKRLVDCALGQSFIADAPWVVVVCANKERSAKKYGERGRELYSIQDATAAVMNMLLAVTDHDLGAVWVGAFDEKEASEILDLPSNVRPITILPIGKPAKVPGAPAKIETTELLHKDGW